MPIAAADVPRRLSINTGPGNSTAQGNVNDSIGGFMSSTTLSGTPLNNLFDDVTGDENAASDVEYRCIFIHNAHGSLTWQNLVCYLSLDVAGGTTVSIGLDPAGNVAFDSATAQAARATDENTAPAGVTFSAPTTKGTGLSIGNLAAGQVRGVWIRRSAANTAALNDDGFDITFSGDSAQ